MFSKEKKSIYMYFTFQILVSAYKFIYSSSLKGDQSSLIEDTVMVLIRYDVHDKGITACTNE